MIAGANGDKLRKDYDGVFLTAMLLNAMLKYRYAIASNMAISEFRGGAERRNQNLEGVGCATIRPARLEDTCGPDSLQASRKAFLQFIPAMMRMYSGVRCGGSLQRSLGATFGTPGFIPVC